MPLLYPANGRRWSRTTRAVKQLIYSQPCYLYRIFSQNPDSRVSNMFIVLCLSLCFPLSCFSHDAYRSAPPTFLQITSGLITVRLFDNRGMLHGDIHVDLKYNNHCYRIPAFLETPGFVNPVNSEMLSENGNGNMWSTRRIAVIMISNIVPLKSFSTRITARMAFYRRNGHSGTWTPDFPVMSRAF